MTTESVLNSIIYIRAPHACVRACTRLRKTFSHMSTSIQWLHGTVLGAFEAMYERYEIESNNFIVLHDIMNMKVESRVQHM